MIAIILSVGAINALVPVIVIVVLIGAAAGATRGWKIFELFGISSLMGVGGGGRGTLSGKGGTKSPSIGASVKGVTKMAKEATVGSGFLTHDGKKLNKEAKGLVGAVAGHAKEAQARRGEEHLIRMAAAGTPVLSAHRSSTLNAVRGSSPAFPATKASPAFPGAQSEAVKTRVQLEQERVQKELAEARKLKYSQRIINTLERKDARLNNIISSSDNPNEYMRKYDMYYRKAPGINPSASESFKNLSTSKEGLLFSIPGTAAIGAARHISNIARGVNQPHDQTYREMYDALSRSQALGKIPLKGRVDAKSILDEWGKQGFTPP